MKRVHKSEDPAKQQKPLLLRVMEEEGYKQDWIKFIVYALSSNDESMDHLENLWDTKSLTDEPVYVTIKNKN